MQRMTMGHIHWTKKISFTLTVSFFFFKTVSETTYHNRKNNYKQKHTFNLWNLTKNSFI